MKKYKYHFVITTINRATEARDPKNRVTFKDAEHYIYNTLHSLIIVAGLGRVSWNKIKITIFESGSRDLSYLLRVKEDFADINIEYSKKRLTLNENTNRALHYGSQDSEYVILVQDDIIFKKNSISRIFKWINEAPKDFGFLTLWNCTNKTNEYSEIHPDSFWGNLFLIFRSETIEQILSWPKHRKSGSGHDMSLKLWALEHNKKIYANSEGLINHVGNYSTLGERPKRNQKAFESNAKEIKFSVPNLITKKADITVILTGFERPEALDIQLDHLRRQTIEWGETMYWQNRGTTKPYPLEKLERVAHTAISNFNYKFHARFAMAMLAKSEYVAIFDDDTMPGHRWFESCLDTIKTHEGILGTTGVLLKGPSYQPYEKVGWNGLHNNIVQEVDLVGHAWFFKRDWLKYFWMEKPISWDNGEDIQFSFLAQKYGGIKTYVPPHPENDKSVWGSIMGTKFGNDKHAHWKKANHTNLRNSIVAQSVEQGWKPLYIRNKNEGS